MTLWLAAPLALFVAALGILLVAVGASCLRHQARASGAFAIALGAFVVVLAVVLPFVAIEDQRRSDACAAKGGVYSSPLDACLKRVH
jgi:divalent metal cation (Fe/Co/Zn/Cd) transporter